MTFESGPEDQDLAGRGRSRTSDIPHRRSLRGFFSSQSPENTCRPVARLQRHRGLLCDGLNGVWKDRRAWCWQQEVFIGEGPI